MFKSFLTEKKRFAVFAVLCSISMVLSSIQTVYADAGDVACAIITFGLCEVTKSTGEDAAKALSDFKITLKLDNVDDIKRLLDTTLDKTNRLLTTTGGELRDTLVTANQQLQESAMLVDSMLGKRIDQLDEVVQSKLLWIAAYTDQLSKELDSLIRTAGNELRTTIGAAADNAGKVIALSSQEAQAVILRTSEESQKLLYAFDRSANSVITNAGNVLRDTIQFTGTELRYTIQTASGEIQTITKQISQEAQVVLATAETHIKNVISFARDAAQQLVGDTTKNLLVAQDGVVFIVERMADLVLAIGAALLGLVLLFLAVNGWGRTLMRGRLPSHRGLRISAVTFMIVSLLVSVLPFIFLSKTARAYALARPYTSLIDQPIGLPQRDLPISSAVKPNLLSYDPNPVIVHVDSSANIGLLTVTGTNLHSRAVTVTFGSFAVEVVSLSTNELKVDLGIVYTHPDAANSIHISYNDGTNGAVAVQKEVPATALPTPQVQVTEAPVEPTATPDTAAKFVVQKDANLRYGPGTNYDIGGAAKIGERFAILAKSPDSQWWQLCCVNEHQLWIYGQLGEARNAGSVGVAQNVPPPPSTATPTPIATTCIEPSTPYFMASATTINRGNEVVLSWGLVAHATSVSIFDGLEAKGVPFSGELKVSLQRTTTYQLFAGYCKNNKKRIGEVTVAVWEQPPTPTDAPPTSTPAPRTISFNHGDWVWAPGPSADNRVSIMPHGGVVQLYAGSRTEQWGSASSAPVYFLRADENFEVQVKMHFAPNPTAQFAGLGVISLSEPLKWIRIGKLLGSIGDSPHDFYVAVDGDDGGSSYKLPSYQRYHDSVIFLKIRKQGSYITLYYRAEGGGWTPLAEDHILSIADPAIYLTAFSWGDSKTSATFAELVYTSLN